MQVVGPACRALNRVGNAGHGRDRIVDCAHAISNSVLNFLGILSGAVAGLADLVDRCGHLFGRRCDRLDPVVDLAGGAQHVGDGDRAFVGVHADIDRAIQILGSTIAQIVDQLAQRARNRVVSGRLDGIVTIAGGFQAPQQVLVAALVLAGLAGWARCLSRGGG